MLQKCDRAVIIYILNTILTLGVPCASAPSRVRAPPIPYILYYIYYARGELQAERSCQNEVSKNLQSSSECLDGVEDRGNKLGGRENLQDRAGRRQMDREAGLTQVNLFSSIGASWM